MLNAKPNDRLWYFAYGSQIWAPGFSLGPFQKATINGYFRDYCILSHLYRGTKENPGLVLGLRPNKASTTHGVAFHISAKDFEGILRQEMITGVYQPVWLNVQTSTQGTVKALTFISRSEHRQCVSLPAKQQAQLIISGEGSRGRSLDYFIQTQQALSKLGIVDDHLIDLEHCISNIQQQKQQQQ